MTAECRNAHPDRTINLVAWEELEEKLKELRKDRGPHSSGLLFRGQGNSCWPLSTTLERVTVKREMSFQDYYESIYRAKPAIESYTEKTWDIPDPHEVGSLTARVEPFASFTAEHYKTWGRVYSYMVYLRHHGFPSPFLDWTLSPYIAAFFAFRSPIEGVKKVSIYAYREMLDSRKNPKICSSADPTIYNLPEQYVRTHRRHFLQQCEYTICAENNGREWLFSSHEDVFARGDANTDVLQKFNIPVTERLKVLKLLDEYNLNAFSLFGSEESLMETMALRELAGCLSGSSS